jgi:CHAT domain-containing protein
METTKLLLSERTKNYYSDAARVAIEYNKLMLSHKNGMKSFEYIERAKSAVLTARFNEFHSKHFAGLPDSLIDFEKEYAININFYATEIAKEKYKKDGYDTLKVNQMENDHFYYSRKLDSLITFLEKNYPAYYELKYTNKSASLSDIQKSLDRESAMINYFVSDTILYVSIVTDSAYSMKEIEIDSNFKKLVTQYYKNLKTAETESFAANSQLLYEKLVKPFEKVISSKKHLIVLPDEYLYYLPFETLISTPVLTNSQNINFSGLNYLIKNYSVTYNLSANLWYLSNQKGQQTSTRRDNFVGFAPVFDNAQNNAQILTSNYNLVNSDNDELSCRGINADLKKFNPLPYTKDEVSSIIQLFEKHNSEATAYLYDAASEANFKTEAGGYKFVHIASHGFSNDEESKLSGIAFAQPVDTANFIEDGILFTGESYSLNLNADLVVLSSCESGMGKLAKGEGLQTLTRGFLYAGAPNIIFSLWKTLDKPTKDLMVNFYSNMLEGETYTESLRLAKLKLIENPKTAMPYFWSSFLIIGK